MPSERTLPGLDSEHVAAHDRFVRALVRRFVADPELAEDLAQDTWLAALRHSAASRQLERAWLGTVARNFVFQAMRGKARRIARETAAARSLAIEPGDTDADEDLCRRVTSAVRALDEPYRTALHLRFYEDLTPTRIAERLRLPPETVRTRIKRALRQVHARLIARESGARARSP